MCTSLPEVDLGWAGAGGGALGSDGGGRGESLLGEELEAAAVLGGSGGTESSLEGGADSFGGEAAGAPASPTATRASCVPALTVSPSLARICNISTNFVLLTWCMWSSNSTQT